MAQNDYYALMQMLQAPAIQRQQRQQQQMDTFGQFMQQMSQQVIKEQAQKSIENMVKEAEKSGKKVEYKVDPNTGQLSPTITSNDYGYIAEELKNPNSKYEEGRSSTGKPILVKKKIFSPAKIEGFKQLYKDMKKGDTVKQFKNPATGETSDIDLGNEEGIQSLYRMQGGEQGNWRDDQEMIDEGLPGFVDAKFRELQTEEPKKKIAGEGEHPIVRRAVEIMSVNPKMNPKDAVAQAQKELNIGNYKSGETRVISGVTYTRDESGQWLPSSQ